MKSAKGAAWTRDSLQRGSTQVSSSRRAAWRPSRALPPVSSSDCIADCSLLSGYQQCIPKPPLVHQQQTPQLSHGQLQQQQQQQMQRSQLQQQGQHPCWKQQRQLQRRSSSSSTRGAVPVSLDLPCSTSNTPAASLDSFRRRYPVSKLPQQQPVSRRLNASSYSSRSSHPSSSSCQSFSCSGTSSTSSGNAPRDSKPKAEPPAASGAPPSESAGSSNSVSSSSSNSKQQQAQDVQGTSTGSEDIDAAVDAMLDKTWQELKKDLKKDLPPEQAAMIDKWEVGDIQTDRVFREIAEQQLGPILELMGIREDPYAFFIDMFKLALILQLLSAAVVFYGAELGLGLDAGDGFRAVAGLALGYFLRLSIKIEHLIGLALV